jgi:hypothetical protein
VRDEKGKKLSDFKILILGILLLIITGIIAFISQSIVPEEVDMEALIFQEVRVLNKINKDNEHYYIYVESNDEKTNNFEIDIKDYYNVKINQKVIVVFKGHTKRKLEFITVFLNNNDFEKLKEEIINEGAKVLKYTKENLEEIGVKEQ